MKPAPKPYQLKPVPQPQNGVTYAQKLSNEERIIDWSKTAAEIDRLVRCFSPRPGARTCVSGKWLKIIAGELSAASHSAIAGQVASNDGVLEIACGEGSIYRIVQLQPEGKTVMAAADFLRGTPMKVGDTLS